MESELAVMKGSLEAESRRLAGSFASSSTVGKTRETELIAAIEAQKRKVLQMKAARDEMAVLLRDVDTAKRAYEAVTTKFNQTSLESQATQTNVSVLSPALEPTIPSFPKSTEVNIAVSVLVGILFGALCALGIEFIDRRVRSTQDLAEMLQLPVLGVIARVPPPRRPALWRRSPALSAR